MMQISERRDSLSLSLWHELYWERDTGSTRVFLRGSPHILSNEQGERGKFTIFYPFLLKERRLHEAERAQPRCAFWFLRWVETGGDRRVTILSNALVSTVATNRWRISNCVVLSSGSNSNYDKANVETNRDEGYSFQFTKHRNNLEIIRRIIPRNS